MSRADNCLISMIFYYCLLLLNKWLSTCSLHYAEEHTNKKIFFNIEDLYFIWNFGFYSARVVFARNFMVELINELMLLVFF